MQKYGTILIIDDNEAVLTALKYCLAGAFQRVLTLSRPDTVLALLQQEEVDMVLLDMNFSLGVNSGQDGLFWLQAIRKRHPELPVVLITAYGDISLAVRGLKSGAQDFITKPWDNAELVRKLKDILDAQGEVPTLDELEAEHIRRAIDRSYGNMKLAAEQLGITRQTLYNKMRKSLINATKAKAQAPLSSPEGDTNVSAQYSNEAPSGAVGGASGAVGGGGAC